MYLYSLCTRTEHCIVYVHVCCAVLCICMLWCVSRVKVAIILACVCSVCMCVCDYEINVCVHVRWVEPTKPSGARCSSSALQCGTTHLTLATRIRLTCSDPMTISCKHAELKPRPHEGVQRLPGESGLFLRTMLRRKKKVPIFLNCIGTTTYSLLRGLACRYEPGRSVTAKLRAHNSWTTGHCDCGTIPSVHGQNHGVAGGVRSRVLGRALWGAVVPTYCI